MTKTGVCDKHVVEDVGRVTDISHREGAERGERLVCARTRDLSRIEQVGMFVQSENVCKNLGGMPEGREGVEHGDGRIFCEFLRDVCTGATTRMNNAYLDFLVVTDASKDALTHATEDAGRVARGLVHAELDVLATEKEGASTEQDGSCLCGDACACAAL